MTDCFIVTGEASGDVVAAGVVREMRFLRPGLNVSGIGAARMAEAGVNLWANSRDWASMGIVQSIPMMFRLVLLLNRLKQYLQANRPSVLILVDFGAFNVRLGGWAVRNGIRTVYLMPPGSWRKIPKPGALERLAGTADLFLCPFRWNADNMKAAGADAHHIGHPSLDLVVPSDGAAELARQLRPAKGRLIALLPGSRKHEVETLAPALVNVAAHWTHKDDRFVMVQAPTFTRGEFEAILQRESGYRADDSRLTVLEGRANDALHACDTAVVCAGTATLEAAVALKPMVVVYNGPWLMGLEWKLRKRRIKAPFIAMPNIIAGREVVKELVGEDATIPRITEALHGVTDDENKRAAAKRDLEMIRGELEPTGALKTAAGHILALMSSTEGQV